MRVVLYMLLGLLVTLAGATVAGWHYRVDLAQAVGEHVAAAALEFPVSFRIAALETDGLIVEDIALGKGRVVSMDRVEASFDLEGLRNRRVERLSVDGIAVAAGLSASGEISVGDLISPDTAEGTATLLPDWRIGTVEIAGIRAHLRAEGRGEAFFSAEAHSVAPVLLREVSSAGPLGLLALFAVDGTLEADIELRPPHRDADGDRVAAKLAITADSNGARIRAREPVALSTGALDRWIELPPAAQVATPLVAGPAYLLLGEGSALPVLDLERHSAGDDEPAVSFNASTGPFTLRTGSLAVNGQVEAHSGQPLTLEDIAAISPQTLLELLEVVADMSLEVDAAIPEPIAAALRLAGRLSLDARDGAATVEIGEGFIAELDRWPAGLAALLPPEFESLAVEPVHLPALSPVTVRFVPRANDRPASVGLDGDLRIVSGGIEAELGGPASLNLPEQGPVLNARSARLGLTGIEVGPVRVTGEATLADMNLTVADSEAPGVVLDGFLETGLTFVAPAGLDLAGTALGPTTARLDLSGGLEIAGQSLRLQGFAMPRLDAKAGPGADGVEYRLQASLKSNKGNILSVDLDVFPENFSASIAMDSLRLERIRPGATPDTLALDGLGLAASDDALGLTIRDGSARLADLGEVTGLSAGLQHRAGTLTGRVGFARYVRDGAAVIRGPVDIDLELRHSGPVIEGSGRASHPSGVQISFAGDYDPSQREGAATVTMPRTEIGPLAASPGDLTELAEAFDEAVRGFVAAEAEIAFVDGGLGGGLRVVLDDIAYEDEDVSLARVSGTVDFDLETAPSTLPRQKLTGLTTAGPFRNAPFELVFDIGPGDTLTIHGLAIQAFGGTLALRDMAVNPYTLESRGRLVVTGADMESMVETIAVDDLHASGRLSGVIPVRILGDRVVIPGGRLESDGAGRLSYWSQALAQAAEGDESMRLLVQALEDFHYDKLTLTVDAPEAGDGVASLRLQGRNPNILDGYPFDININLETDFDKLARMLLDIYRRAGILIRSVAQ